MTADTLLVGGANGTVLELAGDLTGTNHRAKSIVGDGLGARQAGAARGVVLAAPKGVAGVDSAGVGVGALERSAAGATRAGVVAHTAPGLARIEDAVAIRVLSGKGTLRLRTSTPGRPRWAIEAATHANAARVHRIAAPR